MASGLPKYVQIKEKLKRKILSGELPEGSLLPSQRELMDSEKISYATVTRVFSELERENLIYRRQGKGTFVGEGLNLKLNAQNNGVHFNVPTNEKKIIYIVTNRPFLMEVPEAPELFSNYYNVTEITRGILEGAIKYNAKVENLYFTEEEFTDPRQLVKRFEEKTNIGFFFFHYSGVEPMILELKKRKIPYIVQSAMNGLEKDINCIVTNVKKPYRELTQALIGNGYKRIAFIMSMDLKDEWAAPKLEGYKEALKSNGIEIKEELIIPTDIASSAAHQQILEYLKANKKNIPDAFISVNDIRALAAIEALKKIKLKIPQDCAVIGFDNIPQAAMSKPPLATLLRMCREIGYEATKLLVKFIDDPELQPLCKIMTSKFIIRESCRIKAPEELIYSEGSI